MAMTDGMAPEGLPQPVLEALDAVAEKTEELSGVLAEHGYDAGTAVFDIARDELVEALRAEDEDDERDEPGEAPC